MHIGMIRKKIVKNTALGIRSDNALLAIQTTNHVV